GETDILFSPISIAPFCPHDATAIRSWFASIFNHRGISAKVSVSCDRKLDAIMEPQKKSGLGGNSHESSHIAEERACCRAPHPAVVIVRGYGAACRFLQ